LIYPIRLYGDPVLRGRAKPVTDFEGVPALAESMLETMYDANGVGLAAPQIGLPHRMFVAAEYDDDEPEGAEDAPSSRVVRELVVVNPELEILDERTAPGVEGCLSIPEIYEDGVPRPRAVRLRYQDEHGRRQVLEAEDFAARVLLHEFDHLNGRLFLDLLPPEVSASHRTALADMQRRAKAHLKDLKEREQRERAARKPARR
jgi:peptide deformylase